MRRYLLAAFLAVPSVLFAGGNTNIGRYDTVHVVPAPHSTASTGSGQAGSGQARTVVIDGDLADWDQSGEFDTYRFEVEKDFRYLKGYMMYDAENLYIAAHVGDSTPMRNLYSPESEARVAWRGDCLQVRLSTDPKLGWPLKWYTGTTDPAGTGETIAHLTMWYYTPKAQPCLQIVYGMDYHGLVINPAGFHGAYKKDADGKGYVLEYSIPWKLLGAEKSPPKGGDLLACTWQQLWSDPQGRDDIADASEIRNPNNVGMSYQDSGSWGKAFYEPKGHLPQGTVLPARGEPKPAVATGFFPIAYTVPGKDPAKVSLHIADPAGHTVRWLLGEAPRQGGKNTELWDGLNNDGQPVAAGTYTAQWCYQRGVKAKYLAAADNAGNPPWNTSDNTGSWAGDYGTPVGVTATDKFVYLAHTAGEASRILVKLTPDGQRVWGVDTTLDLDVGVHALCNDGQFLYALQGGMYVPEKAGFVKISCANGFNDPIGKTGQAYVIIATTNKLTGIAVNQDTVYVAAADAGKIFCTDKNTGTPVRTLDGLDHPRGLAFGRDGRLYVVTQTGVLSLNADGSNPRPVITGLSDAQQIAVAQNGEIFVSVQGVRQQVLRFDPQGKLLNAIGQAGGMASPGVWVREAMRQPLGICLAPDGKLWVAEGSNEPKRTSVWQVDGQFVREFIGPSSYATGNTIDPQAPEYIYSSNTKFQIDYAQQRTWPVATIFSHVPPNPVFGPGFDGMNGHNLYRFIHHSGRTFVAESAYGSTGGTLYEVKNGRWVGLVATGYLDVPEARAANPQGFALGIDRNQDGIIEASEAQLWPIGRMGWGEWVSDKLDLYPSDPAGFWRVPFEGFDVNGVPRYDTRHMQLLLTFQREKLAAHPEATRLPFSGAIEHAMVDSDGNIYLLINNGEGCIKRDEGFLDKGHRVVKFSPDGKQLLWDYRNVVASHPASRNTVISKPGEILGAIKFTGQFGRYLTLSAYYGDYVILDKETGLFISAFTPDGRADPPLNEYYIGTENFNGSAIYSPKLKKYLFSGGDAQARVWEIQGLDDVKFGSVTIQVTAQDHDRALAATGKGASAAATGKIYGAPRALQAAEWVEFGVDAQRKARAAVTWDAGHLHVTFDVTDDSPMRNRGSNNNLLFKTGDCVEFCLSSASASVDRKNETPVVGDQRILIALVQGQPVAMVYEPSSTRTDKTPGTFSSPTGHATYDHVAPLQQAHVTIRRRADGYTVEAQLDAAELGLAALAAGQKLRADFGVLFSDKGGALTLTRAMWADNSDELGVNNDIPTEARLHPKRWGLIELK